MCFNCFNVVASKCGANLFIYISYITLHTAYEFPLGTNKALLI